MSVTLGQVSLTPGEVLFGTCHVMVSLQKSSHLLHDWVRKVQERVWGALFNFWRISTVSAEVCGSRDGQKLGFGGRHMKLPSPESAQ